MDVGAAKAPQFGGAKHANDHDNRFRHRKSVFQVHCVDAAGQVVIRRQLKRRYVLAFFQKLPPCLISIEACAHRIIGRASSRHLATPCD